MWVGQEGVPHGTEGHHYAYESTTLVVCKRCGRSQVESYSHDCWNHYEDEPWDMYWWYLLEAADTTELRQLLAGCARPLDPGCACAAHENMRRSCHDLAGTHRASTHWRGKVDYARVGLRRDAESGRWSVMPVST